MNDDELVLAAHARGDVAALVALYGAEGRRLLACGQDDAGLFLLTQAYVFALDIGHEDAERLAATLREYGRIS